MENFIFGAVSGWFRVDLGVFDSFRGVSCFSIHPLIEVQIGSSCRVKGTSRILE